MEENVTPKKRTRRTKAQMAEARAQAVTLEPTVVEVENTTPDTDTFTQEPKRRKRRSKNTDGTALYSVLETFREAATIITNNSPYVPTKEESPLILGPIASLATRHLGVPSAPNPDVQDVITLVVGIFGPYRARIAQTKKQKTTENMPAMEPLPFPPLATSEKQSDLNPFFADGWSEVTPNQPETMSDIAMNNHSEYPQPPIVAPHLA